MDDTERAILYAFDESGATPLELKVAYLLRPMQTLMHYHTTHSTKLDVSHFTGPSLQIVCRVI